MQFVLWNKKERTGDAPSTLPKPAEKQKNENRGKTKRGKGYFEFGWYVFSEKPSTYDHLQSFALFIYLTRMNYQLRYDHFFGLALFNLYDILLFLEILFLVQTMPCVCVMT